jgi:hypothetical protein
MSFTQPDPQPLPPPQVPFLAPDGTISPAWYLWMSSFYASHRAMLAFLRAQFP